MAVDAAPMPVPSAMGNVPIIADIVVIMMGRKRIIAASYIACSGGMLRSPRWRRNAKSIIMIAFFLTMPTI